MGGVEYQVTKVDPTNPETKGMVYQVHKVTEEVAATLGGKVYRARIINDPTAPTIAGKVYQIVLIDDPDAPAVKGKVYNAILTGGSEAVVVGPAVSPLSLPDAIANSLSYVKAFGGTEQRDIPDNYLQRQFIYMMDNSYLLPNITPEADWHIEMDFQTTSVSSQVRNYFGSRYVDAPTGAGIRLAHTGSGYLVLYGFDTTNPYTGSSYKIASNTRYKYVYNNNSASLSTGGTVVDSTTFTVNDTTTREVAINSYTSSDTWVTTTEGIYLYSFKAWNGQGELVMNLVPAVQKGTVPVVGFYDTVSKTFKTATAGTFAAGGEAVPTPDTPMDIVSNNGVLKARHQSGLPLGYQKIEYLESSGSQYIDTLRVPNNDDIIEQRFQRKDTTTATQAWYGSMPSSSQITPRVGIGCFAGGFFGGFNSTAVASADLDTNVHTLKFWCPNATTVMIEYDGIELERPQTSAVDCYDPPVVMTSYLFARHGTDGVQATDGNGTKIYYHKEYLANGTLVLDMVPVKRSDNVLGMYDLVSGQFFTNQGTGNFIAGDPVSDPVEIYTDGTVETIEDTIGNTATAEMLLKVGDYQDVQSIIDGVVTRNVGVKVFDGTENWSVAHAATYTYTTNISNAAGQSSWSNLGGLCSHLSWYVSNTTPSYTNTNPNTLWFNATKDLRVKTNSNFATLTDWTNYLKAQYNAGTPVIVIYPLATPTTESVAGQTLQVTDGDNTLEITQASLNNLELEAEYEKEGA